MIRRTDRRTLRTRAALLSAFRELILTRGYESVAVGDIIRRANIGRSTFYLHFTNKQSLLKRSLDVPCAGLAACLEPDSTPRTLVPLLRHFHEQRTVNRAFFEHPIRSIWVRCLARLIERKLQRVPGGSRDIPRLPPSLQALTIAEMQVALITHWLTGAGSVSPESIATALVANSRALARPRAQ